MNRCTFPECKALLDREGNRWCHRKRLVGAESPNVPKHRHTARIPRRIRRMVAAGEA